MASDDETVEPTTDTSGDWASSPSAGLCGICDWVRIQGTKRGAQFYRCARADEDESFLRYPPLPVSRCSGFEETTD